MNIYIKLKCYFIKENQIKMNIYDEINSLLEDKN